MYFGDRIIFFVSAESCCGLLEGRSILTCNCAVALTVFEDKSPFLFFFCVCAVDARSS